MAVSPFALATLTQVKQVLGLGLASPVRDNFIEAQINRTSTEIERFCGRRFVAREYTEFYDGDGTPDLFLTNFPVISLGSLNDDVDRKWLAADTIAKSNIQFDKGTGKVRLWNLEGAFVNGNQNVRVEYFAGYALMTVEWGKHKLDFREHASGTTYTVNVPPNEYDVVTLSTRIARSMSSLGLNSYAVTYDARARTYKIALSTGPVGTLQILTTTSNSAQLILPVLGFGTSANFTGATSYTASTSVAPRVPFDVEQACIDMVIQRYDTSEWGSFKAGRGYKSRSIGDYSESFFGASKNGMSAQVEASLKRYKRILIA